MPNKRWELVEGSYRNNALLVVNICDFAWAASIALPEEIAYASSY